VVLTTKEQYGHIPQLASGNGYSEAPGLATHACQTQVPVWLGVQ